MPSLLELDLGELLLVALGLSLDVCYVLRMSGGARLVLAWQRTSPSSHLLSFLPFLSDPQREV